MWFGTSSSSLRLLLFFLLWLSQLGSVCYAWLPPHYYWAVKSPSASSSSRWRMMMSSRRRSPFFSSRSAARTASVSPLCVVATTTTTTTTTDSESSGSRSVTAEGSAFFAATVLDEGRTVQVTLPNSNTTTGRMMSTKYNFHSLWLRDACRDNIAVVAAGGERRLTSTPVGPTSQRVEPDIFRAIRCEIIQNNNVDSNGSSEELLVVHWNSNNDDDDDASDPVETSRFSLDFLMRYAPVVAQVVVVDASSSSSSSDSSDSSGGDDGYWSVRTGYDIPQWLEPYTGFPDAPAPSSRKYESWDPQLGHDNFVHFQHKDVMDNPQTVLALLQTLLYGKGVALIDNVPDCTDASELNQFIQHALGGLQKDPTRIEANWKIVHKENSNSISYDPIKRLYQHTDSSIPPHGIPGLALSMHYVEGHGANTLTDGYAVAKRIRREDPHGYDLLAKYGYDGERDFAASRVDSTQDIAKGLVIPRKHPIFVTDHTDNNNDIVRLQYNEVFRMPLTLPYDVFPQWYNAFSKFVQYIHDEEVTVPMQANTILLMNNWRVLHGRAANRASPNRHVVGGTIVREAVYSRAMQLARILSSGKTGGGGGGAAAQ